MSYSTTTTLQRTVVFSTTFLIYFVVAANCRYNYDDLLYTANMYIYATTYLSYKRCNLSLSTTIRSRPLFVVLSYRWTTTKVLHICRTKDVIWLWVRLFVVDHYLSYLVTAGLQQKYYIFVVQKMYLTLSTTIRSRPLVKSTTNLLY